VEEGSNNENNEDINDTRFKDMVKEYCIKRENSILKKSLKKASKKHKKNSESISNQNAVNSSTAKKDESKQEKTQGNI